MAPCSRSPPPACWPSWAALTDCRRRTVAATVRYEEVKDWPKLPPGVEMGEAAGVAVDSNGHVFVFHRPGRGFDPAATETLTEAPVLEIDGETGRLIRSWGANTFLVPHGITIDGANNVFLTDVGLHQVFKFSHDGTLIQALGEPRVGKWDATHFNQPTDIAIRPDGSFYVSDGYVNSRVALFDANGKWVREWGTKGAGDGEFSNPHGLSLRARQRRCDRRRSGELAAAALRRRRHVQAAMARRRRCATTGRVFSVATDADGALYVGIRRDGLRHPAHRCAEARSRRGRSSRRSASASPTTRCSTPFTTSRWPGTGRSTWPRPGPNAS